MTQQLRLSSAPQRRAISGFLALLLTVFATVAKAQTVAPVANDIGALKTCHLKSYST
jgi:hypothetical protein